MKPIYVKMSAFGSYAGEETVDFAEVNHGIFLITGDTGAGKTTIFDAITYALYDQTSGGKRDGEMMRSQFAAEEVRTYVELKFIYNGEIYRITRSPRQERISKRKNKEGEYTTTVDQPTVELIMPDGLPFYGKIKETNQKIVDIIGLDVNQFTQIAMIAQGEFLKLLLAPSKERKEIFAKIFNTRIYWRMEEELKNRAKAIYVKLEDNRKDIIRDLENIQYIQNSTYEAAWAVMPRFIESNPESQLALITQMIVEAKQKEEEIAKEIVDNQRDLNLVITELQQAEEVNKLFTALEQLQNRKAELSIRHNDMEAIRSKIASAKKAAVIEPKERAFLNKQKEHKEAILRIQNIKEGLENNNKVLEDRRQKNEATEAEYKKQSPLLAAKISKLNELLPKYQLLDQMNTEFEAIENKKQSTQKEFEKIVGKITASTELQNKLSSEQLGLKEIAEGLLSLSPTEDKLKEKKATLDNLLTLMQGLQERKEAYLNSEKIYVATEAAAREKTEYYDSVYLRFIEGQAGILAHELKEGCPCPVCGSTSHPKVALVAETDVSQKELQNAKLAKEAAEKELEQKKDAMHLAKQSYEKQKVKADVEGKRSISQTFDADRISINEIKISIQECTEQLKEVTRKCNQAIAAKKSYETNEETLASLKISLDHDNQQKEVISQALKTIELKMTEAATEVKNLRASLLYDTKLTAEKELAASQEQTQLLENARVSSSNHYQMMLKEISQMQGKLKTEETGVTRLSEEERVLWKEVEKELTLQGFADVTTYHASILPLNQITEYENAYQKYREEVIRVENSLSLYTEQTAGKARVQTSALVEKKTELEAIKIQLDQLAKSVYGIRSRDEGILHSVKKLYEVRTKIKEEYTVLHRLESTATGKAGQKRINFQTYIQRRYFTSILREANKRLNIMSNGQFILTCRNIEDLANQGEVGLDLDVYSMVNDQTRDVKTLSGGESFMAALAMALGMADIIQNTAGRIHIDTMFIDEGFGSLSDETRMQAIKILNELSEGKRLVGIISHVTELKAQIGTKLIVTKTDRGSKARWEIGE